MAHLGLRIAIAASALMMAGSVFADGSVREREAGVTVGIQVIDAEQTADIFDINLVAKGVQPLLITIKNGSGQTYQFRKADVARYIPAAEAAKQAYDNPLVVGGRLLRQVAAIVPKLLFTQTRSHGGVSPPPVLNRNIQQDFVREEIADGEIAPNGSLEGFLYLRPLEPGTPIRVTLVNAKTQEPLVIEQPAP